MPSDVDVRNKRAKQIVLEWLDRAEKYILTEKDKSEYAKELSILNALIPIGAMGFRGVVLTAIVGRQLDANYDPLSNFYDCNPRSIFEQGIFYALQERSVPCGKSDPLNVAKNIQKLDYDWANGRRPESAARAAVDYLKVLGKAFDNKARYGKLVLLYFVRLVQYAKYVNTQNAPLVENAGETPILNAMRLASLVMDCPEGGTVTQHVVGSLIRTFRTGDSRYSSVSGVDESVFGTNTTSKKPADVWEVLSDGEFGELYEITVKGIDQKRIEDCVDNLRKLKLSDKVVTFICRVPEDVPSLASSGYSLVHKGVRFQFLDIRAFVINIFTMLPEPSQQEFMKNLERFVHAVNRSLKTKAYWREVFGTAA